MISRGSDVGLAASISLSSLASKGIYMYRASGHSFAIQPTTHTQNLHNKTTLYTLQYTTATMKFIIPVLALFATALGNPTQSKRWTCNPGTYSCTGDNNGWQVCNVSGDWVVSYHKLVCDLERGRNLRIDFVVCRHLPTEDQLCFLRREPVAILRPARIPDSLNDLRSLKRDESQGRVALLSGHHFCSCWETWCISLLYTLMSLVTGLKPSFSPIQVNYRKNETYCMHFNWLLNVTIFIYICRHSVFTMEIYHNY